MSNYVQKSVHETDEDDGKRSSDIAECVHRPSAEKPSAGQRSTRQPTQEVHRVPTIFIWRTSLHNQQTADNLGGGQRPASSQSVGSAEKKPELFSGLSAGLSAPTGGTVGKKSASNVMPVRAPNYGRRLLTAKRARGTREHHQLKPWRQ